LTLYLIEDSFERVRLISTKLSQYFPVKFDIRPVESVDKAGIGQTVLSCGCVNLRDPELPIVPPPHFPVSIGVLELLEDLAHGYSVAVLAAVLETLREL